MGHACGPLEAITCTHTHSEYEDLRVCVAGGAFHNNYIQQRTTLAHEVGTYPIGRQQSNRATCHMNVFESTHLHVNGRAPDCGRGGRGEERGVGTPNISTRGCRLGFRPCRWQALRACSPPCPCANVVKSHSIQPSAGRFVLPRSSCTSNVYLRASVQCIMFKRACGGAAHSTYYGIHRSQQHIGCVGYRSE